MYLKVERRPWARLGVAALVALGAGLVSGAAFWAIRRRRGLPEPTELARDTVDESSWESFPASDPPGWIPSRS